MAVFGLNPTEIQNGYDAAALSPYDPERDSAPSFLEGSLTALPTGFQQGGAEIGLLLTGGSERAMQNLESLRPDPQTTGWLANVLQGVGSVVPQATIGTLATLGNPIGGALAVAETKGFARMKELQAGGVDERTAAIAGTVEGVAQGAGFLLPASLTGSLLTRAASGSAINTALGMTQRGITGKVLEDAGYPEMADQYRMLDSAAIFTDAILGGAFGALDSGGRAPLRSERDAALAANNIRHMEIETAPGIPADLATRASHVKAVDLATSQILRGERVDVSLRAANFVDRPQNFTQAIDDYLRDIPFDLSELEPPRAAPAARGFDSGEAAGGKYKNYQPPTPAQMKWIDGVVAELLGTSKGARIFQEVDGQGSTPNVIGYKGDTPSWFQDYNKAATEAKKERARVIKANQGRADADKLPVPSAPRILTRDQVVSVAEKLKEKAPLGKEEAEVAKVLVDAAQSSRSENARQIATYRAERAAALDAEEQASIDAIASREAELEARAQNIADEMPDLQIIDEDGNVTTASEALAKADRDIAQAERDGGLFDAAVNCFLRFGDEG